MLREELASLDESPAALRRFGWQVGGVFLLLAALAFWRHRAPAPWFAGIGLPLVLLGLTRPQLLRPVHRVWMTATLALGRVVVRIAT